MTSVLAALVLAPSASWKPVDISFYTMGKKTADGTKMSYHGRWVATRAFPLGSVVEIRYKGKTLTLTVRDKTHPRYGHRADIPKGTWLLFGAPEERGILKGQWRRVK